MTDYDRLLELLKKYTELFESLTETQHSKVDAVKSYSMEQLDDCMKREQADTLQLRGYDQKRLKLQKDLSLGELPFREILPLVPAGLQAEFTQVFRTLTDAYEAYRAAADCARQMIELNIYRLGNAIDDLKSRTNTASGNVYANDGSVDSDSISFRDMKI